MGDFFLDCYELINNGPLYYLSITFKGVSVIKLQL